MKINNNTNLPNEGKHLYCHCINFISKWVTSQVYTDIRPQYVSGSITIYNTSNTAINTLAKILAFLENNDYTSSQTMYTNVAGYVVSVHDVNDSSEVGVSSAIKGIYLSYDSLYITCSDGKVWSNATYTLAPNSQARTSYFYEKIIQIM